MVGVVGGLGEVPLVSTPPVPVVDGSPFVSEDSPGVPPCCPMTGTFTNSRSCNATKNSAAVNEPVTPSNAVPDRRTIVPFGVYSNGNF